MRDRPCSCPPRPLRRTVAVGPGPANHSSWRVGLLLRVRCTRLRSPSRVELRRKRVRAGISYALAEAMDDGHCGLPAEELVPLAQKLLEVPAELIAAALDLELQAKYRNGRVVGQFDCNKTRDPRFGRKPICVRTLSMSGRARLTITSVPAAFRCE